VAKNKKKPKHTREPQQRREPQAIPKTFDYPPPVDKLLTQGDCRETIRKWPDYRQLGLTEEHIPELIRMATDKALLFIDSDGEEVWAPIHAWRALGQLKAEVAIEPLLRLFHELEDWDWVSEDMPRIFKMIGPVAIPALSEYLADESHGLYPRITAMNCLEEIGNTHREVRTACIAPLVRELEKFERNDPTLNGFLISSLVDMQESNAMPLMERAFKADCVDDSIMGDMGDVRVAFGLPRGEDFFENLSHGQQQPQKEYPLFYSRYLKRNYGPGEDPSVAMDLPPLDDLMDMDDDEDVDDE
jgi:hypothetical protein